jgi:hypothetical protein
MHILMLYKDLHETKGGSLVGDVEPRYVSLDAMKCFREICFVWCCGMFLGCCAMHRANILFGTLDDVEICYLDVVQCIGEFFFYVVECFGEICFFRCCAMYRGNFFFRCCGMFRGNMFIMLLSKWVKSLQNNACRIIHDWLE